MSCCQYQLSRLRCVKTVKSPPIVAIFKTTVTVTALPGVEIVIPNSTLTLLFPMCLSPLVFPHPFYHPFMSELPLLILRTPSHLLHGTHGTVSSDSPPHTRAHARTKINNIAVCQTHPCTRTQINCHK